MDKTTKAFKDAIDEGCIIVHASCICGGKYAWVNSENEMHGCICHNEPPKKE